MKKLFVGFASIAVLWTLILLPNANASEVRKIRPYVLYFDGQLEMESAEVSKVYETLFNDLDSKRTIRERIKKGVVGSHYYTLEAFVEPISESDVEYVESMSVRIPISKLPKQRSH